MKKDINVFAEEVAAIINRKGSLKAEVQKVNKNNGLVLTGITFRKDGSNIGPTVYVESLYESYCNGEMNEIDCAIKALEIYEENAKNEPAINVEFISEWDSVKNHVFATLINAEKNECFLNDVPNNKVMDLAVVYRIMIGDFNDGIGSALIKNNMLETWGVTLDELHECAMKNTKELLGYSKKSMVETIAEMTGEEEPGFMFELPLFVLSTNNKLFGAITMLDTDLLAGICEEAGINKLAIIPSSIHELIAVTDENIDLNAICSMVAEVNDTEVEPEEILSYNMYSFDYLTRSLDVIYASEGSVTA